MDELATIDPTVQNALDILNQTSGIENPQQWLLDALGATPSATGQRVNVDTALGLPVVWNSIQRIAGHIGLMPLELRRKVGNGSEVVNNTISKLLTTSPSEFQTAQIFKETMMAHALLVGNGRAWIRRSFGIPVELLILPPQSTYGALVEGEKWVYTYLEPDYVPGGIGEQNPSNGQFYRIPDDDCLCIPGLGWNGFWGLPVIDVLKDTFGLDQAGADATAYSFRNNGRPGLMLEAPRGAFRTEKEADEFMAAFNKAHEGVDKAGRTGLIREGMKAHVLPISAADSQFLEQRQFSREDLALVFGTELMFSSHAVYKDLQERNATYIQHCLNKWLTKWENECARKLLPTGNRILFWQFDGSAFTRGNPRAVAEYANQLADITSVNERREMNGLNPIPGGDEVIEPTPTPTEPEAPADDTVESPESQPQTGASDSTALVRALVARDIRYEARRVTDAAARSGSLLHWANDFYDKFEQRLSDTCDDAGIGRSLAVAHCQESKDHILRLCQVANEKDLPEAVAAMCGTWSTRTEGFTNARRE